MVLTVANRSVIFNVIFPCASVIRLRFSGRTPVAVFRTFLTSNFHHGYSRHRSSR